MAQTPPFEIPQQLRELAERNVEQARAAYGQFMDAMVQATGMWMGAMPTIWSFLPRTASNYPIKSPMKPAQ